MYFHIGYVVHYFFVSNVSFILNNAKLVDTMYFMDFYFGALVFYLAVAYGYYQVKPMCVLDFLSSNKILV